jgi:hypothetical protein
MNLNLPKAQLSIQTTPDGDKVFDPLRKKYVAITPEEIVRQNFTAFLISYCGYPAGLMANEIGITLNGTSRRCDTVVYSRNGKPLVIIEYKAPSISINQRTFDQIVRYNMVLQASYLIVSNGLQHYCCSIDYANHTYKFLPKIPPYNDLKF